MGPCRLLCAHVTITRVPRLGSGGATGRGGGKKAARSSAQSAGAREEPARLLTLPPPGRRVTGTEHARHKGSHHRGHPGVTARGMRCRQALELHFSRGRGAPCTPRLRDWDLATLRSGPECHVGTAGSAPSRALLTGAGATALQGAWTRSRPLSMACFSRILHTRQCGSSVCPARRGPAQLMLPPHHTEPRPQQPDSRDISSWVPEPLVA